jgi:hypothetical protein
VVGEPVVLPDELEPLPPDCEPPLLLPPLPFPPELEPSLPESA